MIAIEYNKVKISVPESWDDITLGFYETFYTKKPETARERVALVAHICKINADLLLSWPTEVFDTIVKYIDFLFQDNPAKPFPVVEIEGVKYVVPIEDKLSLGAWVDAEEVQKRGENVLSNILAIVCLPTGEDYNYKNNEARAAMFAALPVSKVLGVLAFFLHCKTGLEQRIATYTRLAAVIDQLPRSIKYSLNRGGGIRLSLIWQTLKYYALIVLLRYQLRKFLLSCNTVKIKTRQKTPSVN